MEVAFVLSSILAIIGSFVAWAGEPMGAILFIPLIVLMVWNDIDQSNKNRSDESN